VYPKVSLRQAQRRAATPPMAAAAGDASLPGETMVVEAFVSTRSSTPSNTTPKNSNPPSKRSEGSSVRSSFLTRARTAKVAPMHAEASFKNPHRSEVPGHAFDGGGVGVGNGQLAQVRKPPGVGAAQGWCVHACVGGGCWACILLRKLIWCGTVRRARRKTVTSRRASKGVAVLCGTLPKWIPPMPSPLTRSYRTSVRRPHR